MRPFKYTHCADPDSIRRGYALCAALLALCVLMPADAGAQLPLLIDLSVPLGQEVTPVYRVFTDNITGDIQQSDALAHGDFDGDSFGDILLGASTGNNSDGNVTGGAYILYGGQDLLGAHANLNSGGTVSSAGETRILGGGIDYVAGYAVAAGDVNGDGLDDAIVGQPGVLSSNPGRVRIVYGSAGLPGQIVNLANAPSSAEIATTEVVGMLDDTTPSSSGQFGRALASGDVNGDGFDDVIVGAYATDTPGGTDTGAVFIVFGSASLPGTTVTAGLASVSGVSRILGDDAGDSFGWSVTSGDVDGDGYDDVVVGAPAADPAGGNNAGEAYIVYGAATWPETVDLNTNGALSAAGETRLLGDDGAAAPALTDDFGWSLASGDLNGDGLDEVLVGARRATTSGRTGAGEAYVFYGSTALRNTIRDMNTSPNGAISPAGETRLLGAASGDQTGFAVAVGDVDGDGRADVLAGARQNVAPGGLEPGRLYMVPNSAITPAAMLDLNLFSAKVTVRGALGFDLFGSSATAGADMNRDGYSEFVGFAPNGDNPFITETPQNNAGYAAVVFGDGISSTASATASFAAGATPLKGLGGRMSPGVRAWISFGDGSAGKASGTLTRNAANVTGIPQASGVDVAQVLWQLSAARPGWTSAHVVLRYTDSEVAGQDETKLVLYQATSTSGPWTALTGAVLDTDRNEVSADVDTLGYFALAADTLGPALSIGPPSFDITRDGPVSYTVTYSPGSTITLSANDVQLHTTGTADADVSVEELGPDTRSVTLSNLTGDGTIGISLAPDTARDESDNPTPAAGPSIPFRVDHTPPEIAISGPSSTTTAQGPVSYTVTYGGATAVTLSPADVELVGTGLTSAEVSVLGDPGSSVRTVTLSNVSGDGTLGISLASGTASDEVGNLAPAATAATQVTVDNTPPTVSIGNPSVSATRGGPVTFTVTYGGASSVSLNASKVTLNRTGSANGTVAVSGSGSTTRTVTISSISGDGTLGISIQTGTATDALGNTALGAGPSNTFTVDNTGPTVSIGAPSVTQTQTGPILFAVTYAGATTVSLAPGDVNLIATGDATGTVTIQGSGATERTVAIENITGDGTLGISLDAGTASDTLGNTAPAAGPSANVAVGSVELAVSIGPPNTSLTRGGPVSFTITYTGADEVTLQNADVTLDTTGTVTGTVSTQGTGITQRTVVVSDIAGDGAFTISLAAGTASNTLGNTASAVGPSATVTVDNTAPTLVIGAPSTATTQTGPVTFQITYAGATFVSLGSGDISLIATGTAAADIAVSGTGIGPRTVTLSSIAGNGTLAISVASGTALDEAGNGAPAAGPSATVTVQNTSFNAADVNRDGKLNATDVQMVINAALGRTVSGFPDVNGDNKVNATDVQRVINGVLGRV